MFVHQIRRYDSNMFFNLTRENTLNYFIFKKDAKERNN